MSNNPDISSCANPKCGSEFKRLGEGRLAVYLVHDPVAWGRRKPPSTTKTPTQNKINPELGQAIRLRAYILFERRGQKHGHDLDDWLQAEAELTEGSALLDASCSGWLSLPH